MSDKELFKLNMSLEYKIPTVPNFILPKNGIDTGEISIADLSTDQLDFIADLWKRRLHERAEEIRKNKK